jgi:hypothetical protein
MRYAVLFVCLCGVATLASAEHHIQEFNGVTASFRLLNRSLRLSEPLKVALTLHNSADHPVEFRHLRLLQHIEVFSSNGERVMIKLNAPFFKSAVYKTFGCPRCMISPRATTAYVSNTIYGFYPVRSLKLTVSDFTARTGTGSPGMTRDTGSIFARETCDTSNQAMQRTADRPYA